MLYGLGTRSRPNRWLVVANDVYCFRLRRIPPYRDRGVRERVREHVRVRDPRRLALPQHVVVPVGQNLALEHLGR